MVYTTKDNTEPKEVIGIKLNIGTGVIPKDMEFKEFLEKCSCNLNIILECVDNPMNCRFYDEATGEIYFHFQSPVEHKLIKVFFKDEELIFPIVEEK